MTAVAGILDCQPFSLEAIAYHRRQIDPYVQTMQLLRTLAVIRAAEASGRLIGVALEPACVMMDADAPIRQLRFSEWPDGLPIRRRIETQVFEDVCLLTEFDLLKRDRYPYGTTRIAQFWAGDLVRYRDLIERHSGFLLARYREVSARTGWSFSNQEESLRLGKRIT